MANEHDRYFCMRVSADGAVYVKVLTEDGLRDALAPADGEAPTYTKGFGTVTRFLTKAPSDWQMADPTHILIIKGRIIVPQPVHVVTTYALPDN